MVRASFALAAGSLLAAATPAAAQPGLTMTCHPMYKGNDLGPQVYRVRGNLLIKTDPSRATPIVMSSAVKRQPLDRTVDRGVVTYSSASHTLRGPILTRRVFWANARGKVTRSFTETYNFRTKTIRGLTGDTERCR